MESSTGIQQILIYSILAGTLSAEELMLLSCGAGEDS